MRRPKPKYELFKKSRLPESIFTNQRIADWLHEKIRKKDWETVDGRKLIKYREVEILGEYHNTISV